MARKISVELVGNASSLDRAFKKAGHSARSFHSDLGRTTRGALAGSGVFHGLGRSLAFGSTQFLGGAGAVYLGKQIIDQASRIQEETEKTGVVFGKNARQVQAWSMSLAQSFGIGSGAALEATGRFGNMFRPLGIGEKHAAKMSERLVTLAADMASFNNAKPDEVLKALSSGLAGQVRPLRQYGVFLDMARLKAEAFSSGIVKANVDSGKVAMAQDKVNKAAADLAEAQKKYGRTSQEAASAQAKFEYQTGLLGKALKGTVPQLTSSQKVQAAYNIILQDT
jgi:hypothetical protein